VYIWGTIGKGYDKRWNNINIIVFRLRVSNVSLKELKGHKHNFISLSWFGCK
jgi:hypothetical protein